MDKRYYCLLNDLNENCSLYLNENCLLQMYMLSFSKSFVVIVYVRLNNYFCLCVSIFFFFFKPLVQIALGSGMTSDLRSLQHLKIRMSQSSKIVMLHLYGLRGKHSEYTPIFHLNSFFCIKGGIFS